MNIKYVAKKIYHSKFSIRSLGGQIFVSVIRGNFWRIIAHCGFSIRVRGGIRCDISTGSFVCFSSIDRDGSVTTIAPQMLKKKGRFIGSKYRKEIIGLALLHKKT
jgi:hypothetical protein